MANLAELNLALSQPCRRCAQLLHGRVKFCPYCGSENDAPPWGHEAANAAFGPGRAAPDRATPDDAEQAAPPQEAAVPRPEVEEKTELPAVLDGPGEAGEARSLDIAHIVPAAFEWPDDPPAPITTVQPQPHPPTPRRGPILMYAAIGAGMVATVLALVFGYVRSSEENEAARSRALTAQLAQAQGALVRGDFIAAERDLAVLAAAYPGHPGVRELSDALDRRMQEQLARQEELREATRKATLSLGLGASGAPPSAAKAPPAAQAPVVVAPATPPVAVQEPEKSECNAALAALALCAAGNAR
jgi:hypothetical protein